MNMDKGTHFYKCDFQVHTPRDLRWEGAGAQTDEERRVYAAELIGACRSKGLDAIAVTDHHDFAFFPYVKEAALNETDNHGALLPEEKRIVVFPGLELSLSSPACQAILILDANFPIENLDGVLRALSITPAASSEAKHAVISRISLDVITNFSSLYKTLNSHDILRGRYIILPNVTENGHGTLLRQSFGGYYKDMPCVGCYIDGSISRMGTGNTSIVNGENAEYGNKAVGIFQTSDNRKRNHTDLGSHSTWVKLSEPTAEALRQACLARQSRIIHTEPELPPYFVASIEVSSSKFLGEVSLDFNKQYNAIIGGRGTGKSTILEYLRWGLCDQPRDGEEDDAVQNKRDSLIDKTLKEVGGSVTVTILLNELECKVRRVGSGQIMLKMGENEFEEATEQQVRDLFPVQAYSQKQLSRVGNRVDELKRFVELPIKKNLDDIESGINDVAARIKSTYGNCIRLRETREALRGHELEISSIDKQLETLRAGLTGLSAEDQGIIAQKVKYEKEQAIVVSLEQDLLGLKGKLSELSIVVGAVPGAFDVSDLQNPGLIDDVKDKFERKFAEIRSGVAVLSSYLSEQSLKDCQESVANWENAHSKFLRVYEAAKSRASVNQAKLETIAELEGRAEVVKGQKIEKMSIVSSLGDAEADLVSLRREWRGLQEERLRIVEEQCGNLSALSSGLIIADIKGNLDTFSLTQRIKSYLGGMIIREDKVEKICNRISLSENVFEEWAKVLAEFELLALHSHEDKGDLPQTPILFECDFKELELERISSKFDTNAWVGLSLEELTFNPRFQYCSGGSGGSYINFADASAGQQATALLGVLLSQQGWPLIIDQPEDDIDSKMIDEIVKQIWSAKNKRQLIFSSHNANFVVNGDAELVICCDYRTDSSQTLGKIKYTGAIDNKLVRSEIALVTEGGEKAFRLRQKKYGF